MFISHKSNVLQTFHETEWQCRRKSKGMSKPEYWAWIETITDSDEVVNYPSESFTIVECTDEDVKTRLSQLNDYVSIKIEGKVLIDSASLDEYLGIPRTFSFSLRSPKFPFFL